MTPTLVLLASVLASAARPAPKTPPISCRIVAVEDAATFRVVCGGRPGRLRLPGVRAPVPGPSQLGGEPFADGSRRLASALLAGEEIQIERPATARASRVRLGGRDLSLLLLRSGLVFAIPEGGTRGRLLVAAERAARAARIGVWSLDAWKAHRDDATRAVDLPFPTAAPPEPTLGQRARALTDKPWEERKAAFEKAVAALEDQEP